jgi:hypothetical protein
MISPAREAAEAIVNEEREAKAIMPVYKGLENFKLINKMGEYVFHSHLPNCSEYHDRSVQRCLLQRVQSD